MSESPLLLSAIIESCSSSDYDDMAEIVLKILERQHVTVKALCRLIDEEVKNSTHAPTLFRGNSFTTRLLTSYVRAKGFLSVFFAGSARYIYSYCTATGIFELPLPTSSLVCVNVLPNTRLKQTA